MSALLVNTLRAQNILSRTDAIDLVLENNFDIQIAKNDLRKAENNASLQNSGFLPTVSTNANANVTYYNGENRTVQGDIAFDAADAYSYGASLDLNYTVFSGNRMYNYKQLKEQRNLSELQARQVIELSILELSQAYFQLAQIVEQKENLKLALSISRDRLKRAKYSYDYGQATKLELLNAEVDFNNDSINYVNIIQSVENAERNLNFMMNRDLTEKIRVDTSITFNKIPLKSDLLESALARNVAIEQTESQLRNNEWALKKSQSNWLPKLNFGASYVYNGSENPNGAFLVGNYITGPQANFTLSWNLFNGSNNVQAKNARIEIESQLIRKDQAELDLRRNVLNAYTQYSNALFVFDAQKTNVLTNKRNFDRSEEMYKKGQINSITFRQAQLNYLESKNRLSEAKYNAKYAELQLLQLSGALLN